MQLLLGWILIIFPGLLFLFQLISSINFSLAQRLGIQEKTEAADPLLLRAERYVAYWDLLTLVWLPVAGLLMILDHRWWPVISLLGGAIYIDAAGREAAKNFSFRHAGLRMGTRQQQKLFLASYLVMLLLGIWVIVFTLQEIFNSGTF